MLYEENERWHDLVRHLEGMLKKSALAGDTQVRLRLAELMDSKLSDPQRALTVLMTIDAGGRVEILKLELPYSVGWSVLRRWNPL